MSASKQIVSGKSETPKNISVDTSNFIVVPPQLFKEFGQKNKRAWFLDLEQHVGHVGILLMTLQGCALCAIVASLLSNVQKHSNLVYKKQIMVYVLQVDQQVLKSKIVQRNLNVSELPHVFICKTTTGRLVNLLDSGEKLTDFLTDMNVDKFAQYILDRGK